MSTGAVLPSSHRGDCGGDPPGGGDQLQPASGCAASGGKLGKRKRTKNLSLKVAWKKNSENPLKIDFEEGDRGTYVAVGDNSDNFNSLAGTIISKIPYYYPSWKDVPKEHTCTIFDELQNFYDVAPHIEGKSGEIVKAGLELHFGNIYKNQKWRFGKKHFEDRGGVTNAEALMELPPKDVPIEDWKKFVRYRCSDEFQKRSKANKDCRKAQEIKVRNGRRNLAQYRYEHRGKSAIDMYKELRTKEGVFTESKAAKLHADMVTKRKDPSYQTSSDDDIVQEVLGERRGWTRAVGQKLPRSIFSKGSSSSNEPKYTQLDVQRMLEEYTAPLWSKLAMTPPPLPILKHVDPQEKGKENENENQVVDVDDEDDEDDEEHDDDV